MFSYVKLTIAGIVLSVGIAGYFFVNKKIGDYETALTEVTRLTGQNELLVKELKDSERELQERILRDVLVSDINTKREEVLQESSVVHDKQTKIIEDNRDEECVSGIVPKPILNSLLSYAKERNSHKD